MCVYEHEKVCMWVSLSLLAPYGNKESFCLIIDSCCWEGKRQKQGKGEESE